MRQNVLAIIEGAQHTLDIEMAYVHVDEFCEALVTAVKRGVKVRLISNSQSGMDAEGKWHINRQFYPELLAGGVRLYELPTFTHRKLVVADRRVVFLSTGNPEWNSWERGWDELVFIDSPALAADIEKRVFTPGFSPSYGKEVTLDSLQQESLLTRIKTFVINALMNLVMSIYLWGTGSHRGREARRNYVTPGPAQKTKPMPLPGTSAPALLCLTPPLKRCA
jgi:cardiolipin synthase